LDEKAETLKDLTHQGKIKPVNMGLYHQRKQHMVKLGNKDHFSNDVILLKKAIVAEKKLFKLREKMLEEDPVIMTGAYWQKLPKLLESDLYKCLNVMPKTVVHHVHLTAAAHIDFLVDKLCYYDYVYFNEKEQMFKVNKNGVDLPGYVKVNTLRQFWTSATSFDEHLKNSILLHDGVETQEHHEVWKYFQPKFFMANELYNYSLFFEKILYRVCKNMIKQMVTVIEFKHIFGGLFDEDGPLSLEREIAIFNRVRE